MVSPKKESHNHNQDTFSRKLIVALGSAAGSCFGDTLVYPFDTMNTWIKLDSSKRSYPVLVKEHIRRLGYPSLYNGVRTQFGCIFIPEAIYFASYEFLNKWSRNLLDRVDKPYLIPFIPSFSATAGEALSLCVLVPMDAVKTRM